MLENEELQVLVIPHQGGRITSLRSRRTDLEFLLQSSRLFNVAQPGSQTDCWTEFGGVGENAVYDVSIQ